MCEYEISHLSLKSLYVLFSALQVLQADALLQTEKILFVYFFTEPDKLGQIVSDLARRVDSIALANQ